MTRRGSSGRRPAADELNVQVTESSTGASGPAAPAADSLTHAAMSRCLTASFSPGVIRARRAKSRGSSPEPPRQARRKILGDEIRRLRHRPSPSSSSANSANAFASRCAIAPSPVRMDTPLSVLTVSSRANSACRAARRRNAEPHPAEFQSQCSCATEEGDFTEMGQAMGIAPVIKVHGGCVET